MGEWGIEKAKEEDVFREMISDVSYSYYHKSPMVEAYQKIRKLNDSVLGTFCSEIRGLNAYSFMWTLDSLCRDLLRKAISTMHKLSSSGTDSAEAFATTMEQLVHDAKLCFQRVVQEGFRKLVDEFFDENLIEPCMSLVAPIESSIPEMFKTLLSIDGLLREALDMSVDKLIQDCTI